MRRLLCYLNALLFLPTAAMAQTPDTDKQAVIDVIASFHTAISSGDTSKVVRTLGPTFFIADERSNATDDRVRAHMFLTGDRLSAWPGNYLREVGPHRSTSVIRSINIRGNAAVAITLDTGSNKFRSWKDEETTWFLGRHTDGWRIAGYVIRDFQMPRAP